MIMKYIIFLITLLLISSCDTSPRCIDASDFGQPQALAAVQGEDVEARFGEDSDYSFFQKTWSSYTGYTLTGSDLVIRIQGAWSPWPEILLEDATNSCGRVHKVCTLGDSNAYDFVAVGDGYRFAQNTTLSCTDASEPNICWFPNGIGVYVGLSYSPRTGLEVLYHLADPVYASQSGGSWRFTLPGSELEEIKDAIGVNNFSSVKVYIRVHDNDYDDNINGCIATSSDGVSIANPVDGDISLCETPMDLFFESGARREDPGFLENAARIFMDPAKGIIETSYKAYIESPTYQNIFYSVQLLFIVFTAIGYFTAFLQLSIHAIWGLFFRFAIISTLLHPNGWEFFNEYVVTLFWDGSAHLANIVLNAFGESISNQDFITNFSIGETIDASILQNVDNSIGMFVSYAVNSKIMALLFSDALGWLLIVALYFAFYIFIFAMLKLTVIFIFIFITITILLSMAPVFILFAFFKYTREAYFEKWLQSLISVSIQPMMLFVFIGIFLSIINYFLMDMLYFKACWENVFSLIFFDVGFWEVGTVYNYNDGSPEVSDDGLQIAFVDIFMLFLGAMIIRYVTEQVPQVAEKIGGGFSMAEISQGVMAIGKTMEYLGEEMVKTTAGSAWKRTGGAALSAGVNKFAPKIVSKYAHKLSGGLINKTDTARMAKAKKAVRADLASKGWKDKEIKDALKSGKLKGKLKEQMKNEVAKDDRYGRKSLNPLKIAEGIRNEIMDNVRLSMEKAQKRAAGKKFTKDDKRKLRKGFIKGELKKANSDPKTAEKLEKRADAAFNNKFGKEDLRDSVRELKDSGKNVQTSGELNSALLDKMKDKGYDEKSAQGLIDADTGKGKGNEAGSVENAVDKAAGGTSDKPLSSRIRAEFGDLPDKAPESSASAPPPPPEPSAPEESAFVPSHNDGESGEDSGGIDLDGAGNVDDLVEQADEEAEDLAEAIGDAEDQEEAEEAEEALTPADDESDDS